jgi:hypothetical protein
MPETIDLSEIVANNPGVDEALVREAREMLSKLRQSGFCDASYDLLPPYTLEPLRRRGLSPDEDPRAVHLRW